MKLIPHTATWAEKSDIKFVMKLIQQQHGQRKVTLSARQPSFPDKAQFYTITYHQFI